MIIALFISLVLFQGKIFSSSFKSSLKDLGKKQKKFG
jgi:hypothetical protein